MVITNQLKFHFNYNQKQSTKFVNNTSIDEKEAYLKELVMKSLKEKNFSDHDLLDTLFAEVKQEIQQNANNSC